MKKTASTLMVNDIVFIPSIHSLREYRVTEIKQSECGIQVGLDDYSYRINYSDYNAAISTNLKFDRKKVVIIRKEDALKKQQELRLERLKELQEKSDNALKDVNDFVNKYFHPHNL